MSRGLRWIPPGEPVEITTRTLESRRMLPMTPTFRRQAVGTLARAAKMYRVRIHAVVMLSNHYHCLATPDDGEQLARFMEFVNGNLARQALRSQGRSGRLWGGRYHAVPISPEEPVTATFIESSLGWHALARYGWTGETTRGPGLRRGPSSLDQARPRSPSN